MTPEARADLRRKADRMALAKWREAHPLETAIHRLKWYEARKVRRVYRDLIKEGA